MNWDHARAARVAGSGRVLGITCLSARHCVAVEKGSQPLVQVGNPSSWGSKAPKQITLGERFGSGGVLRSVTCASLMRCVAVGQDWNGQPLVLTGNPAKWSAANAKEITLGSDFYSNGWYGGFGSIVCTSSTWCVAVGTDGNGQPLVLVGNPSSWNAKNAKQITLGKRLGGAGSLSSVACPSSRYCVSVGQAGTSGSLVLAGNPATWSAKSAFVLRVAAPKPTSVEGFSTTPADGTGLTSISCRSKTYCAAVGGDNHAAPLYITGDPRKWKGKLLARPAKHGASFTTAALTSTACTRKTCFAGGFSNGGDFIATLKPR